MFFKSERYAIDKTNESYRVASPFPHAVIDDFCDPLVLAKSVDAIKKVPENLWKTQPTKFQQRKYWLDSFNLCPEPARTLLLWFNSSEVLYFMSWLTGIPDLIPDLSFHGGGIHSTGRGGSLGVHCDFNLHQRLHLHRRVNALLFLNEDWEKEWGGYLELWEQDMSACAKKLLPIFNRLVVFTITDTAFHGQPEPLMCPEGMSRLSLAMYYYTANRPTHEISTPHHARWMVPDAYGNYQLGRSVE